MNCPGASAPSYVCYLFLGTERLAASFGRDVEICSVDIVCHRRDDLAISTTREKHLTDLTSLRKGLYDIVAMSPPCSTFSRATWASFRGPRPVRSYAQPRGLERLTAKERDRAIIGNIFADFSFEVAKLALQSATFFVLEQPEDLGAMPADPRKGQRPTMWQWPQHAELVKQGLRSVCFHQSHFGTGYHKPTRLLLKTGLGFPDFVRVCPGWTTGYSTAAPHGGVQGYGTVA